MASLRSWSIPSTLFVVSLIAYVGMVSMQFRHGNLGGNVVLEFLTWFGLAFIVYAAAIFWLERWWRNAEGAGSRNRPSVNSFLLIVGIWGAGCLFRWLLLQTFPTLSSDVFRYMWDGHVTANGISPYAHAINAAQLDWLDTPFRAQANHAHMASPYLPAAQWYFTAIALFYPLDPQTFQVAAVLFDLATAFILSRLLARAGLPAHRLLIYLWNPLVIVETAQGAHVDALMVMLMMLAVYSMCKWTAPTGRTTPAANSALGVAGHAFSVLTPALLALATSNETDPPSPDPHILVAVELGQPPAVRIPGHRDAGFTGTARRLGVDRRIGRTRAIRRSSHLPGRVEFQQRPVSLAGDVALGNGRHRL